MPDTAEKAFRLAAVLADPLPASRVRRALEGLVGDDDLLDRVADAFRPGEPDGDASAIVGKKLEEWLASPGTFVRPWTEEAARIVAACAADVRTRSDARIAAFAARSPGR